MEKNKIFFREPNEPDRVFAKGRKVEAVFLIISKGIPLPRTEGVGDITLLTVRLLEGEVTVPVILPEKIQAKLRRQMLEILRGFFTEKIKQLTISYENLGYSKIGSDGSWNCYIAPPLAEGGTDIGMCGFCPSCQILGSMLTKNELKGATTSYGLKSRALHDIAFSATIYEKAISEMTHTKVGDGVSYTGMSLFQEMHVLPSVCFIGKITLCDLTPKEAKIVLSALSSISRIGAGETKYGSVQTILLGLKAGSRETISSYDIVRHVIERTRGDLVAPEKILRESIDCIREIGFTPLIEANSDTKIGDINAHINISEKEIEEIWRIDNYNYAKQVIDYISKIGDIEKRGRKGEREAEE
jgi:CRISPR type I-D-associated protein Csc2